MQDSDAPTRISVAWASGAGAPYRQLVPTTSQIGVTAGRASWIDGFPPLNFVRRDAGGTPPFGDDMNGALYPISDGVRWLEAGYIFPWSSGFSSAIGGHPKNAVVGSAVIDGLRWRSTVDNNTTNPDAGGAGWVVDNPSKLITNLTVYVNASTGSDSAAGTSGAPWLTLQHAWDVILAQYDVAGLTVTVNCTGAFTTGLGATGTVRGARSSANIVFDFQTASSVNVTNSIAFQASEGAAYTVKGEGAGLTITASGAAAGQGSAFLTAEGGFITIGSGIILNSCGRAQILAVGHSLIQVDAGYTIIGAGALHWWALGGGRISIEPAAPITIILSGSPAFTTFAVAEGFGLIACPSSLVTFSGAAASGAKFSVINGVIGTQSGDVNYFPGTSAGSGSIAPYS